MKEQLYQIIKTEIERKDKCNISPCSLTIRDMETLIGENTALLDKSRMYIDQLYNEGKIGTGICNQGLYLSLPCIAVTKLRKS